MHALLDAIEDLVDVEPRRGPAAVLSAMARREPLPDPDATGTGRIGLVSGELSAVLRIRPGAFAALQGEAGSAASRGLDVNRLSLILGAAGRRCGGARRRRSGASMSRTPARRWRAPSAARAVATFLLDGPPVTAVTRVAAATEVMPQKSTFFDPKAPTGLVFGPLEW